jgi:hypothetical protein
MFTILTVTMGALSTLFQRAASAVTCVIVMVFFELFTLTTAAQTRVPYKDKNSYFQVIPPEGWEEREFDEPRSKVEWFLPGLTANQRKASLFFLGHPLSGPVDVEAEAKDRVARLREMGSPDASLKMIEFAGAKAAHVEGSLPRQGTRMKVLMFTNYDRSYTISFTASSGEFATYLKTADEALTTFKCLPTVGTGTNAGDYDSRIQQEKIRVLINGLEESDLGLDASNSLLAIGAVAIPQLEEAERSGTLPQRRIASELVKRIREKGNATHAMQAGQTPSSSDTGGATHQENRLGTQDATPSTAGQPSDDATSLFPLPAGYRVVAAAFSTPDRLHNGHWPSHGLPKASIAITAETGKGFITYGNFWWTLDDVASEHARLYVPYASTTITLWSEGKEVWRSPAGKSLLSPEVALSHDSKIEVPFNGVSNIYILEAE